MQENLGEMGAWTPIPEIRNMTLISQELSRNGPQGGDAREK